MPKRKRSPFRASADARKQIKQSRYELEGEYTIRNTLERLGLPYPPSSHPSPGPQGQVFLYDPNQPEPRRDTHGVERLWRTLSRRPARTVEEIVDSSEIFNAMPTAVYSEGTDNDIVIPTSERDSAGNYVTRDFSRIDETTGEHPVVSWNSEQGYVDARTGQPLDETGTSAQQHIFAQHNRFQSMTSERTLEQDLRIAMLKRIKNHFAPRPIDTGATLFEDEAPTAFDMNPLTGQVFSDEPVGLGPRDEDVQPGPSGIQFSPAPLSPRALSDYSLPDFGGVDPFATPVGSPVAASSPSASSESTIDHLLDFSGIEDGDSNSDSHASLFDMYRNRAADLADESFSSRGSFQPESDLDFVEQLYNPISRNEIMASQYRHQSDSLNEFNRPLQMMPGLFRYPPNNESVPTQFAPGINAHLPQRMFTPSQVRADEYVGRRGQRLRETLMQIDEGRLPNTPDIRATAAADDFFNSENDYQFETVLDSGDPHTRRRVRHAGPIMRNNPQDAAYYNETSRIAERLMNPINDYFQPRLENVYDRIYNRHPTSNYNGDSFARDRAIDNDPDFAEYQNINELQSQLVDHVDQVARDAVLSRHRSGITDDYHSRMNTAQNLPHSSMISSMIRDRITGVHGQQVDPRFRPGIVLPDAEPQRYPPILANQNAHEVLGAIEPPQDTLFRTLADHAWGFLS